MKTILVIEDEELVRTSLSCLLNHLDYETIEATNGSDGLNLSREKNPDLVLCDVNMPGMDGHAVLRNLREDPSTNSIPFIFLTGQGEREDLRRGMNSGADDYLTKPVSLNDLRNAISVRLNRREEIANQYARELHRVEEKLQHLFYFDQITELPNRLYIIDQFRQLLSSGSSDITLFCVTMDRFKRLSGIMEPAQRDLMLSSFAQRLQKCLGKERLLGRISEDEFVVLIPGEKQVAVHCAEQLLHCIRNPVVIEQRQYHLTASIGISIYPSDGNQFDDLFGKAGAAARKAGNEGGNQFVFYSPSDSSSNQDDLVLENELREAIELGELDLYYQPQVDVKTGEILGCEALLRWNHPTRGMIPPMKFIPIAEESGLIVPLGQWALSKACSVAKALNEDRSAHLRMSVNLSPSQFKRPDLVEGLVHILSKSGIDPQDLELEVTESILINNAEAALIRLNELKALGVRLSLDDFGTGYSTFSYLKNFPFDTLKIDRSFIKNIHNDPKSRAIVIAIIQMAKSLNLRIVAEGVETASEFAILFSYDCDEVQGYLFSPALPPKQFAQFLASGCSIPAFMEVASVHRNS